MLTGACAYIVSDQRNRMLYTGSSTDLHGRVVKHKKKHYPNSFSAKHNCNKLVYYEVYPTLKEAFAREWQIKKYSHLKKVELIVKLNPEWRDLHEEVRYL